MSSAIQLEIEQETRKTPVKQVRAVLADAYSFIASSESNKAIATVTLEDLISDQISRNGESSASRAKKYNPYSYDPSGDSPTGTDPEESGNFSSGADLSTVTIDGQTAPARATKLDRILAIQNELADVIADVKKSLVQEIASVEDYTDASSSEIA